MFFKVSTIISVCVKFQYLDIRGSALEIEYTPGLVSTGRVQIKAYITVLTNEQKIDILDHFASMVKILELELRDRCERIVGLI